MTALPEQDISLDDLSLSPDERRQLAIRNILALAEHIEDTYGDVNEWDEAARAALRIADQIRHICKAAE